MKKVLSIIFVASLLAVGMSNLGQSVKYTKKPERPLWNDIMHDFQYFTGTMVGGDVCSTYPDEYVRFPSSADYTCPSRLSGGCAIDVYRYSTMWDNSTRYYWDGPVKLDPGEEHRFYTDREIWVYYCNTDCDCDPYESQGCGAGPCGPEEMYKTRNCNTGCDLSEEVCVSGYSECEGSTCSDAAICDRYGEGEFCSSTGQSVISCRDTDGDGCLEADTTECNTDEVCSSGKCVTSGGEANFEVSLIDAPLNAEAGKSITVEAVVKNTGDASGSTRLSCGIYADRWKGKIFGLFSTGIRGNVIADSECCYSDEFSAETSTMTIKSGQTKRGEFTLKAPTESSTFSCGDYRGDDNWGESFTISCGPFKQCYQGYSGTSKEVDLTVTTAEDGGGGDEPSCKNECDYKGDTKCRDKTYYECGNYDSDSCLEWNEGSILVGKCGVNCKNDNQCPTGERCQSYTCEKTAYCGDQICQAGETSSTCSEDCGGNDSDGDGVANTYDECPGTPAGSKVDYKGCQVFEIPWKIISVVAIIIVGAGVGYYLWSKK